MEADSRTREELLAEIGVLERRLAGLEAERERFMAVERVLRQGEDRYRRLLESVTDYVYTVTVRGGRAVGTEHGPNCVAGRRRGSRTNDGFATPCCIGRQYMDIAPIAYHNERSSPPSLSDPHAHVI